MQFSWYQTNVAGFELSLLFALLSTEDEIVALLLVDFLLYQSSISLQKVSASESLEDVSRRTFPGRLL